MLRPLYLTALLILQIALVVKLAPPLAQALRIDALPSLAPEGWPAMLQLGATGLAVAGGLAMAAAGVLCAELLRRSVAPVPESQPGVGSGSGRIEVTYPPELRTHALPNALAQTRGRQA